MVKWISWLLSKCCSSGAELQSYCIQTDKDKYALNMLPRMMKLSPAKFRKLSEERFCLKADQHDQPNRVIVTHWPKPFAG